MERTEGGAEVDTFKMDGEVAPLCGNKETEITRPENVFSPSESMEIPFVIKKGFPSEDSEKARCVKKKFWGQGYRSFDVFTFGNDFGEFAYRFRQHNNIPLYLTLILVVVGCQFQ